MSQIEQPTSNQQRSIDPRAIIAVLAMLYGLSPIDAMPDFIPILGQVDDAGVILLAVITILVMTLAGAGNRNNQ